MRTGMPPFFLPQLDGDAPLSVASSHTPYRPYMHA